MAELEKKTTTKRKTTAKKSAEGAETKKTTTRKKPTPKVKEVVEKEIIEEVVEVEEKELSPIEKKRLARRQQRELLKQITNDVEITVFCNASNTELLIPIEGTSVIKKMNFGDVDWFTVGELKALKTNHPKMFSEYYLIPIDVAEGDIELEDVLKLLGIERYYNEDILDDTITEVLFEDCNAREFEDFIEGANKEFGKRVLERAIQLYREEKFNDSRKMNFLEKHFGKDGLFSDLAFAIENFNQNPY